MSIHNNHRARVKARFLQEGLDVFNEHQVLELLLFYCIPRRDTNEIAHNLINRFGSLHKVVDASVKELEQVEGMGKNAATFLSLLKQFQRYYQVSRSKEETILNTIEECGKYLLPFFNGRDNETVFMLCLDAKCKVLCCRMVDEGSVNSAGVSIRKIVDIALSEKATSVILAHNHPSGLALPSAEDMQTTQKVGCALHLVDVVLIDHLVIADGEFVSMAQSNLYDVKAIADIV